jgi:hypothetical protein
MTSESTVRKFSIFAPQEVNDLYILDLTPERKSIFYDKRNKNYNTFEFKNQVYFFD